MDITALRVNADTIENGDWVGDIPEMGGLRLRVRGISSRAYQDYVMSRVKVVPRGQRDRAGNPLPAILKGIIDDAVHETILLDWEGVTAGEETVPYSRETAHAYLHDPDLRVFRAAVDWAAGVVGKPGFAGA